MEIIRALLFLCICLLLFHGHTLANGDGEGKNEEKNIANSSNATPITNSQVKMTNAADLTEVQLKEVGNVSKSISSSSGERRRKITPTGNMQLAQNATTTANQTTDLPSININVTSADSAKVHNGANNTTTLEKHEQLVAENVALNFPIGNNSFQNDTKIVNNGITTNKNDTTATVSKFPQTPVATIVSVNETTIQKPTVSANVTNTTLMIPGNTVATASSATATTTTNAINATSTTSTTSTTTTTTTTPRSPSTTTLKPKKPKITYGIEDFPDLEANIPGLQPTSKLPASGILSANDGVSPYAQPSREMTSGFSYSSGRDYIVPILTVIFTVPLVIGVLITSYRRFRDCWSTRHYRRMDFLVDGMYND